MAKIGIKFPIQVNLPDDWMEQIVNRLRNDPEAEWVEIVRCKDCKYRDDDDFCMGRGYPNSLVPDDGFCDKGERSE